MRRKLIVLVILSVIIIPLAAAEFRGGAIALVDRGYLSDSAKAKLSNIATYKEGSYLNIIGPQLEFAYSPLSNEHLALGLKVLGSYGFVTGINGEHYLSRNNDFRATAEIGLTFSYNFMNTTGFFLDAGFSYDWYRIANTNDENNKNPVNYVKFSEYGIKGTLGIITRNRNSYYKFGISYGQNLSSEIKGFSLGMLVAGGFIF